MLLNSKFQIGIKCSFLDEVGEIETWEYQGNGFTNTIWWKKIGSKGIDKVKLDIASSSPGLNKLNPYFFQLHKNLTDDTGAIVNSNDRMIYTASIDETIEIITSNAYRAFLYKNGIFIRQGKIDNNEFAITPGEADELKLLMLDLKTEYYYLYFNNPSLKEYIAFGDTETDKELQENLVSVNKNLQEVKESLYKLDINETIATNLGRGYIKISGNTADLDNVSTDKSNWQSRIVLKLDVSDILKIEQLYVKSDADCPFYVICDETGTILLKETSSLLGGNKRIDIDISSIENAKWILWGNDYSNPVYEGYLYYNTLLSQDLVKIKEEISDLSQDLNQYSLLTEYFKVRVNTSIPSNNITEQNNYSADIYDYDDCYFAAPKNITENTKLVILCHGGGQLIEENNGNEFIIRCVGDTFRALGYAVLATNGMPKVWATEKGLENASAPIGNWMALESIVKAYDYVVNKYEFIDKTGCYIWGTSQGGMVAENAVELSNIPFKACCYEAPAISMRYAQLYLGFRAPWIKALYGFDSVETYDKNKCLGLDPFIRNMDKDIPVEGTTFGEIAITGGLDQLSSRKFRKEAPLLIQHGMVDSTVSPIITQAYIKAIQNAGNLAEFKGYNGIDHGVSSLTTKYSMQGVQPVPLYTTAGILDVAKWFYRFGGYPIPSGLWGNETE